MQVIAVIGDIVGSRRLPERAKLQDRLVRRLRQLRGGGLASPFTLTLGDEFQAVYTSSEGLFADVFTISAELAPATIRFAFGLGALSTRLNRRQALRMDGPAFHRAREGIEQLKKEGGIFRVIGADAAQWALANHGLAVIGHRVAVWSETRLGICAGLLRNQEVAEMGYLGVSRVAIYKNIRAAALKDVTGFLSEIARQADAEVTRP